MVIRGFLCSPWVFLVYIILFMRKSADGFRLAGGYKRKHSVPFSVLSGTSDFSVFDDGSRLLTESGDSSVENDGFTESIQSARKIAFKNFVRRVMRRTPNPGTLIMVRHGESMWNYNSTFTGWVDVDLSARGVQEVEHASRLLLERGYTVDIAFTSRLKRAIRSTWVLLREIDQIYRPVLKVRVRISLPYDDYDYDYDYD